MNKESFNLVLHPIYAISLLLLILNDVILKYTFHSFFTGKLSDVTGIFCFVVFLYECFRFRFSDKKSFFISGVITSLIFSIIQIPFLLDKVITLSLFLNLPEPNLTPDYTDLLALFVLPVCYLFIFREPKSKNFLIDQSKPIFKKVSISFSVIWFVATSFVGIKTVSASKQYELKPTVAESLMFIEEFFYQQNMQIESRTFEGDSLYSYSLELEEKQDYTSGNYTYKRDFNLHLSFKPYQSKVKLQGFMIFTRNFKLSQEEADSLVKYDFLIPFQEYIEQNKLHTD